MIPFGGFDLRNLFTGPSLALLIVFLVALAVVIGHAVSFRGSVVV